MFYASGSMGLGHEYCVTCTSGGSKRSPKYIFGSGKGDILAYLLVHVVIVVNLVTSGKSAIIELVRDRIHRDRGIRSNDYPNDMSGLQLPAANPNPREPCECITINESGCK